MAHVDNLRRYFPAVRDTTYLNSGTFGLLPESCVKVMKDTLSFMLEKGRTADNYLLELTIVRQAVRDQLAYLLHAEAESFVLTDSTVHGVNIVMNGIVFQPGDEVIITDTLHSSVLLPIFNQKRKQRICLRIAPAAGETDVLCEFVESQINQRTRLIAVSHVSPMTGIRLPIEKLTKIAHEHNVWILIDGTQGVGVEPISLQEIGCDFYAFPGQKWLCAPDGTGALYIRKELLPILEQTFVGVHSLQGSRTYSLAGDFTSSVGATRYEHSVTSLANWRGFLESVTMQRNIVGFDYAYSRIHGLTRMIIDELLEFQHAEIVTPREHRGGLVHFRYRDTDVTRLAAELSSRQIIVEPVPETKTIRVSPHFYNSEDDILRLFHALRNL
jgi:L-cysteine/cystine lyase